MDIITFAITFSEVGVRNTDKSRKEHSFKIFSSWTTTPWISNTTSLQKPVPVWTFAPVTN